MIEPIQTNKQIIKESQQEISQTYFAKKPFRSNSCDNLQIFEQNQIKIKNLFKKLPNYDKEKIFTDEAKQRVVQEEDNQKYFRSKSQDYKQKFKRSVSQNKQAKLQLPKYEQILQQNAKKVIVHIIEDFCNDILELEAFHFKLSSFGLSRSPLLSLAPIVAYYTYSILIDDDDYCEHLYKSDKGLNEFYNNLLENRQLIKKLKLQSNTQLNNAQKKLCFSYVNQFLALIPFQIQIENLDTKTIFDDFINYSNLYIDQKQNILDSLKPSFIYRNNNVLIAQIRFVFFNNTTNQSINYRFPISKFDDIQFIDSNHFSNFKGQDIPYYVRKFLNKPNTHSEKCLTQYLILDAIQEQKLFKQLKQTFNLQLIDESQLRLNSIQIEITTELRICEQCVRMLFKFPIQFYCEKLLDFFQFNLNDMIDLIILSQFQLNPKCRIKNNQHQNELLSSTIKINNQQIQQQQNRRYFISQFELDPTGLISNQFFEQRYLLQGNQCFKKPINEIQLNNTLFISSNVQECVLSEDYYYYNSETDEFYCKLDDVKQIEVENDEDSKNSSKEQSIEQHQQQNETDNDLIIKLNEFKENFQATKLSQQPKQIAIIQQDLQSKSFEQIIEELKIQFLSTIIKSISQNKSQEKMFKLGFYQLENLFTQLLVQQNINKYKDSIFKIGIMFNKEINRELIIKDYQFFKKYSIVFFISFTDQEYSQQNVQDYNECFIQLICQNNESKQFEIIKSEFNKTYTIDSCKDSYFQIKELINTNQLSILNQYYIIVLSIEMIQRKCIEQIAYMLCKDEQMEKFKISLQFIHFNLNDRNLQKLINFQQNQKTIEIKIQNFNPITIKELTERYITNGIKSEINSYHDTKSMTNLSQFKCDIHDDRQQYQEFMQ